MKSASLATVVVAITTAALFSSPAAEAQDFGRMLGRLAERTAERAARNGVDELTRPRPAEPRERDRAAPAAPPASASASASGPEEEAPVSSGVIAAPEGVEPWPINAGHRAVTRTNQLAFSPEMIARKQAFEAASVYECQACEAGRDIDSWKKSLSPERDTDTAWSELIGSWEPGRVITWRGRMLDGRITVLSDYEIAAFQCRQLRHRISTRGPNPVVTERPGLICNAKQEQYSSVNLWHEVF